MTRARFPLLLTLLLATTPAWGDDAWPLQGEVADGPLRYQVRLSHQRLPFDGELELEETLTLEGEHQATFPALDAQSLEGLGVISSQEEPPRHLADRTVLRRRSLLEPQQRGSAALATRWVVHGPPAAPASQALVLPRIELSVVAPAASAPSDVPRAASPYLQATSAARWPYLAALAGVLALLALGLALRRRRQPPLTSWEAALAALRRLDAAGKLAEGATEAYLERLAAILRLYLAERFDLSTSTQTSAELLATAREHPDLAVHRELLQELTELADAAKFAGAHPPSSLAQRARESVERLILATRPRDEDEAPDDPAPAEPVGAALEAQTPNPERTT